MKAFFAFLNGKKTVIGMLFLMAAQLGRLANPAQADAWKLLDEIGYAFGAVGVLHKAVKE